MACEREQQRVTDLEDALSLAQDQCADGIHGACGRIAGLTRQVAEAKEALAACVGQVAPPPPPPPPPQGPCEALRAQVTEVAGDLQQAQEDCQAGIHGQCARIAGLRHRLAQVQAALDDCLTPKS